MKEIVATITHRDYRKAVAMAEAARDAVPERYNRQRVHAYAKTLEREILGNARKVEIETEGRDYVYYHTANIGTRKWPDFYREFILVDSDRARAQFDRTLNRVYLYR